MGFFEEPMAIEQLEQLLSVLKSNHVTEFQSGGLVLKMAVVIGEQPMRSEVDIQAEVEQRLRENAETTKRQLRDDGMTPSMAAEQYGIEYGDAS